MRELLEFFKALWADKRHRTLWLYTTILTMLLMGAEYELWAKPKLEEIESLQKSQYQTIIEKLDKLDSKLYDLNGRVK